MNAIKDIRDVIDTATAAQQKTIAAMALASLPRKIKRWTGYIDDERMWRGRKVILPNRDVAELYGCVRGRAIVRVQNHHAIAGFTDFVYNARDLRIFRNPAARLLGQSKRGTRERRSEVKPLSSKINGSAPPRAGSRRRGRPTRKGPRG